MHTDSTLKLLEDLTKLFGALIRRFTQETSSIATIETPKEAEARCRHTKSTAPGSETVTASTAAPTRKPKKLNLLTYKFHAMGDYPEAIRYFGTIDSTSTQRVFVILYFCLILVNVFAIG